jgi:hypothetical protein
MSRAAALVMAVFCAALAPPAVAQTFIPQGPAPGFGPSNMIGSRDAPPNGTDSGAVQAIAVDPTNATRALSRRTVSSILTSSLSTRPRR